jgi:flagellar assembly factor FliW
MELMSNQFGKISFEKDIILTFHSGVFGFENLKEYIIIDDEDTEPFRWLMSIEEPEVCFPLLDPFLINQKYNELLPKPLAKEITDSESSTLVMGIITLRNTNDKMTINLKGPIVINLNESTGKQIILNDEEVEMAYPLN